MFDASTFEHYVPAALRTGEFRLPEDGPVSWTAHADLVVADVAALMRPGVLDGVTPPLTAAEMLDFSDVAGVLSELTGRTITRVVVDDEEFRAARAGQFAGTDPALENLLGRPAISARAVLSSFVAQHQRH